MKRISTTLWMETRFDQDFCYWKRYLHSCDQIWIVHACHCFRIFANRIQDYRSLYLRGVAKNILLYTTDICIHQFVLAIHKDVYFTDLWHNCCCNYLAYLHYSRKQQNKLLDTHAMYIHRVRLNCNIQLFWKHCISIVLDSFVRSDQFRPGLDLDWGSRGGRQTKSM